MPLGQGTPKTLAETGFKMGDLVSYACDKHFSGGVIFQIVEDTPPVTNITRSRLVTRMCKMYVSETNSYERKSVTRNEYGVWDEKGKKLPVDAMHGFIRIRPLFEFFATPKCSKPSGKGSTIIVKYRAIVRQVKAVDLVVLGAKYLELGNIMRDIAKTGGG